MFIKELTEDGYKITQVKRDGNSFFRAISVSVHGTEERHQEFRSKLVKYLWEKECEDEANLDIGLLKRYK